MPVYLSFAGENLATMPQGYKTAYEWEQVLHDDTVPESSGNKVGLQVLRIEKSLGLIVWRKIQIISRNVKKDSLFRLLILHPHSAI